MDQLAHQTWVVTFSIRSRFSIWVWGETRVGKGWLAEIVHLLLLVEVDCSSTVVEARQFVDVTPIEYGMITFITAVAEQCTDNLTGGVVILHKQNLECSDGKKPLPADDWPQRLLLLLLGITTLLWRLCDIRYLVIVQISDHDIDLGLIFFRESLTFPSRGIPDFPVPVLILMVTGRLPLGSNPIVAPTMRTCHQPDSRSRIALGWTSRIPTIVQQWNVHICKLS